MSVLVSILGNRLFYPAVLRTTLTHEECLYLIFDVGNPKPFFRHMYFTSMAAVNCPNLWYTFVLTLLITTLRILRFVLVCVPVALCAVEMSAVSLFFVAITSLPMCTEFHNLRQGRSGMLRSHREVSGFSGALVRSTTFRSFSIVLLHFISM